MYSYENLPSKNKGFSYGIIGGLIMVVVHLMLLLIFQGTNQGDLLAFFLAWFVYVMIGRTAAEAHYKQRELQGQIEPCKGCAQAGQGAALITSLVTWSFIIVRAVFRDMVGYFIITDPLGLCVSIVIDVLIALGLGSWAGGTITRKYCPND